MKKENNLVPKIIMAVGVIAIGLLLITHTPSKDSQEEENIRVKNSVLNTKLPFADRVFALNKLIPWMVDNKSLVEEVLGKLDEKDRRELITATISYQCISSEISTYNEIVLKILKQYPLPSTASIDLWKESHDEDVAVAINSYLKAKDCIKTYGIVSNSNEEMAQSEIIKIINSNSSEDPQKYFDLFDKLAAKSKLVNSVKDAVYSTLLDRKLKNKISSLKNELHDARKIIDLTERRDVLLDLEHRLDGDSTDFKETKYLKDIKELKIKIANSIPTDHQIQEFNRNGMEAIRVINQMNSK